MWPKIIIRISYRVKIRVDQNFRNISKFNKSIYLELIWLRQVTEWGVWTSGSSVFWVSGFVSGGSDSRSSGGKRSMSAVRSKGNSRFNLTGHFRLSFSTPKHKGFTFGRKKPKKVLNFRTVNLFYGRLFQLN